MPSVRHELLVDLFRNRPSLAVELLSGSLGARLPPHKRAYLVEPTFDQLLPPPRHADAVVLLEEDKPIFAVVVEVQLGVDADKPFVWPFYAAALRARCRVPVCLLVVAPDPEVEAWARRPIATGQPGCPFIPVVIGREGVPRVVDAQRARAAPELAMLSVIAHGGEASADSLDMAVAAVEAAGAVAALDKERATLYYDNILSALNEATRRALEVLMQSGRYEYQSEFARRYYGEGFAEGEARGKAEGKAEALIAILGARGFSLSDDLRTQILGCRDPAMLDRWITRAVAAASAEDVLR
jgi:hypothetical protein